MRVKKIIKDKTMKNPYVEESFQKIMSRIADFTELMDEKEEILLYQKLIREIVLDKYIPMITVIKDIIKEDVNNVQ
jgi:hypothetical protein